MAIFNFKCVKCGGQSEHIMSWEKVQKVEVICEDCGMAKIRAISLPAKTPGMWGTDWRHGLSSEGKFDSALGKTIYSEKHRDKVLESKGLIRESDLPKDFIENSQSKISERIAEQDKLAESYSKVLAETGDATKAMTETFTAESCLDGTLDSIYDTNLI